MSTFMNSGIADEETLKVSDGEPRNRKRRKDNKTVTFGDSSSVRSMTFWSVVSFILVMFLWWSVTKAWGYPDDFKATLEDGLRDRQLFEQCQRAEECDTKSYTQVVSPLIFPSVRDTWNAAGDLFSNGFRNIGLWTHTWASLWRVLKGMFWGSLFGIPIGLSMGLSSRARGFFDTIVESLRPIPPLALLPLFTLSFGLGEKAAVPLLVFASIWIMIIASRSGIRNAQLSKVRAAYSLGASKPQLLWRVLIPNALPEIFTGLLDVIVVGIVIIAALGVFMDVILRLLESILIPWQGKG